jgi:hypothetical protein
MHVQPIKVAHDAFGGTLLQRHHKRKSLGASTPLDKLELPYLPASR